MANAITQKGQVTIPKHIREKLGVGPGDRVAFAANDRGDVLLCAAKSEKSDFMAAIEEAARHFNLGMSADEWLDITRGSDRNQTDSSDPA